MKENSKKKFKNMWSRRVQEKRRKKAMKNKNKSKERGRKTKEMGLLFL